MEFVEDKLREAVAKSKSYTQVLENLGIADAGTTLFAKVKSQIKKLGIDISHFTGLPNNRMPSADEIKKAVAEVTSMAQLMEKFNRNPNSSGSRVPFEKVIDEYKMDRSHWKGQSIHTGGRFTKEK